MTTVEEDPIDVTLTPTNPIKMIAIDIDGTLLTPQQQISPRTRQAIQKARAAGIIITLATARRYGNSKQFATELDIDIPLINYDGALIIHHPDSIVLHTHPFPIKIARQASDIMIRYGIQPVIQRINDATEETWSGPVDFDHPGLQGYATAYPGITRVEHAHFWQDQINPLRVVAFATEAEIAHMLPEITQLDCSWHIISKGSYNSAELSIMGKACSKALGVTTLAQHLNIPLTQVMAIGDNTNDSEMLQTVGWGVAMGQAPAAIQEVAHAVTATNSEDGVALAIERYALRCDCTAASNSRKR
ncbi:MAG TPA: HAD family hydrolase [Dictyobacter sp.]|jgi:Cof subfamily protein (haloacid dehalogenase superfamily)|nr:HAD family hydrolase [Dictyobacter sp.]